VPDEAPTIAVLGAGVAGICMGIQLKRAGFESFTIYEKSPDAGGTWLDNTYPGVACDVPSHLYCFSFEPNPDWSRKYSAQPEIHRYLEHCIERHGLRPHIRYGVEIAAARFDEAAGTWRLRTAGGEEITARVMVSATGQLNRPHVPAIPGLESFGGRWFHSARWDHTRDLTGTNVAVVGNGASAIQFVPCIAPLTKQLTIYQRTPNWLVPRNDRAYRPAEKWIFRHVPLVNRLYRSWIWLMLEARFFGFFKDSRLSKLAEQAARQHLEAQITNPRLRAILTPDYPVGCKRILISDDYYPALERPNVEVVTDAVVRVTRDGVVTQDGTTRPADTIIFATGFETTTFLAPMEIEGAGGRRLSEAWRDGAEAYLGVAVSGFPNLFMLYGPNTNLGHNSIIFMVECQVRYVIACVRAITERRLAWLDVRTDAMARFNAHLQDDLKQTAWDAGCTSWYKTASGKVTNNWSGFTLEYWWRTREPDFSAFEARPAG